MNEKRASGRQRASEEGLSDFVRRLLFPDLPADECLDEGLLFFPSRRGPSFRIPCDGPPLVVLKQGLGSEFVNKPGTVFAAAVAAIGRVGLQDAMSEVSEAAGMSFDDIERGTVGDVARAIFERALETAKREEHDADREARMEFQSAGATVKSLAKVGGGRGDPEVLADLSKQTGLDLAELSDLPLRNLGDHLGVLGVTPQPGAIARTGTTVCVYVGGSLRCGQALGLQEGAVWGALVGYIVGGFLGAVIGGVIGALLLWLYGLFGEEDLGERDF